MKQHYIYTFCLFALLAMVGCRKELQQAITTPESDARIEEITDAGVLNSRLALSNQSLEFAGPNGMVRQAMATMAKTATAPDCQSGCTRTISGNVNATLEVGSGEVVCVESGAVFNGGINMKGGALRICGTVNLQWISGNKGEIMITAGGKFSANDLSIQNGVKVTNYSNNFSLNSELSINGEFVNYGIITLNGINVNGQGAFTNGGEITVNNNVNVNHFFLNEGLLKIQKELSFNGNSTNTNNCRVIVGGNINSNSRVNNNGYMQSGNTLYINGKGAIYMTGGAYLKVKELFVNDGIYGGDNAYARVDVSGKITVNGSGVLDGKLDINDPAGISIMNGRKGPEVTVNGDKYIAATECNPGAGKNTYCSNSASFTLIANVAAPVVGGNKLSATDVRFRNGYAYVSYHQNGEAYAGALEVFNVSNPVRPSIVQLVTFKDAEFNGLGLDDSRLFAVGQRNPDKSKYKENNTRGAIIEKIPFSGDMLAGQNTFAEAPLPSFSGNSVLPANGSLWVVSGATGGGLFSLDYNSLSILTSQPDEKAKYLATNGNQNAFLTVAETEVHLKVFSNGGGMKDYKLDLQVTPLDGKNVVVMDDEYAYITLSKYGVAKVKLSDGSIVARYQHKGKGLTNGATIDPCFVYLANGADGLVVLQKKDLSLVGTVALPASSNLVAINNDMIFVASGTAGLQIIQVKKN
ncbi:LVIVD repeat-containing protein [Chitinophaga flava]|nr:hypothetical protein [Chitinophaga flava]